MIRAVNEQYYRAGKPGPLYFLYSRFPRAVFIF